MTQYDARTILAIWASATLPMALLGWLVAPWLAARSAAPVLVRLAVLTVGLAWQGALTLWLVRREAGGLGWAVLRARLWLGAPRTPTNGETGRRAWWALLPVLVATALFDLRVKPAVDAWWVTAFPFLAQSGSAAGLSAALATPAARAELVGAWGTWTLYVANALLNTVAGEELLFRGLLLPRMQALCGRWDWLVNALLFGAYHLHQPWGMVSSAVHGLLFAGPSRYYRSAWLGIAAHSGQSVYFMLLLLALVLGAGGR